MAAPFYQSSGTAVAYDRRSLVYQVTQDFHPLWELGSVEDFEQCYIDLLDTHFRAYDHACVLHRDISEHNAMSRRGSDGKAIGFLNDWDLGCFVDADGIGTGSTSQHHTGTTPFMAIDLQRAADGTCVAAEHRYCHDLESFFWLLLWAVLHFDLENKSRLSCTYEQWTGDWAGSNSFKWNILSKPGMLAGVLKNALDMWKGTVKRWVIPLARMICDARERSTRWDDDAGRAFDDNIYAKEMNFDLFMRTIKQMPREGAHEKDA
ncbi:uncharacterized protein SCHCODRAFT_02671791 [Schizophyllum commune H4-8]|nr:uncharacterized protein SCHCODRAFT_02671791 [Schizophyllum commune H4-8]KAI5887842.1 hypothetical protein SCHCODRAFT_02671791 [Schizophyllum commune H4-8]